MYFHIRFEEEYTGYSHVLRQRPWVQQAGSAHYIQQANNNNWLAAAVISHKHQGHVYMNVALITHQNRFGSLLALLAKSS